MPEIAIMTTDDIHPDRRSAIREQADQVARIRAMVNELRQRDAEGTAALRDYVRAHLDALDEIEKTLRQVLEGLDAAEDRQMYNELRMQ